MTHTILTQLIPQLEIQEDKKVITITDEGGEHLGLLYYELAKKGFTNKPIGLNKWGMVECKIERLYEKYPEIEPLDVLRWGTQIANSQRETSFLRSRTYPHFVPQVKTEGGDN